MTNVVLHSPANFFSKLIQNLIFCLCLFMSGCNLWYTCRDLNLGLCIQILVFKALMCIRLLKLRPVAAEGGCVTDVKASVSKV